MADSRVAVVARRALAATLEKAARLRYRVEARGVENFTGAPSTLVVANHRHDSDLPILSDVLYGRHNPLGPGELPHFVAREDLFRRGFLREYLEGWPVPVRELLGVLDLSRVLELLRAHPMRRIPELTVEETLEHVLASSGDRPLQEVLRPEVLDEFERRAPLRRGVLLVSQVLSRRYRPMLRRTGGLKGLTREQFRSVKAYEQTVIERQLQTFVNLLSRGEVVHIEPEGVISEDGSFSRIRGGIHTLLNAPAREVRVLPVCVTYDSMITGRQRVFVNVGPEISKLRGLPPAETSRRVAEAILAQATVTASQLATHRLVLARSRGVGVVTMAEVDAYVADEATRRAAAGAFVDPRLLADAARTRRLESYVRHCLRSRILVARDDGTYRIVGAGRPSSPGWTEAEAAIGYMEHELSSLSKVWPEVP